jgi:hypothetical protein
LPFGPINYALFSESGNSFDFKTVIEEKNNKIKITGLMLIKQQQQLIGPPLTPILVFPLLLIYIFVFLALLIVRLSLRLTKGQIN